MNSIQITKEEMKKDLENALGLIKALGHYSFDVEIFYVETIKKLDKTDFKYFKDFTYDLESRSLSFLEEKNSSDRLALTNQMLEIFPMSREVINKIAKLSLFTLEDELKKSEENVYYGIAFPQINLRLCCISILSTISLFKERFEHFNLNEENYKHFLKIADIIEKSKNEQVVIKKEMFKIKKKYLNR